MHHELFSVDSCNAFTLVCIEWVTNLICSYIYEASIYPAYNLIMFLSKLYYKENQTDGNEEKKANQRAYM